MRSPGLWVQLHPDDPSTAHDRPWAKSIEVDKTASGSFNAHPMPRVSMRETLIRLSPKTTGLRRTLLGLTLLGLTLMGLTLLGMTTGTVLAQTPAATSILERYQELRPRKEDLAMYQLDWAPSLPQGLVRAKQEKRPVFLIVIHAKYGDIHSGHC